MKGGLNPKEESDVDISKIETKLTTIPQEWESFARGKEGFPKRDKHKHLLEEFIVGNEKEEIMGKENVGFPTSSSLEETYEY